MADFYKQFLKPFLFSLDAEQAHHITFFLMKTGLQLPFAERLLAGNPAENLKKEIAGVTFQNPVGLAAGMDKNALLTDLWPRLGFGFAEIGTVTPRPQVGNPRPRLFRLPEDQAILNRMGFNNDGLAVVAKRLSGRKNREFVVGGNIGKNKDTANNLAHEDYLRCFLALVEHVEYFTINLSSPNTPGLRSLLEKEPLQRILEPVQNNNLKASRPKPVFLKISPDMEPDQIPEVAQVCQTFELSGIVATNTTVSRENLHTGGETLERLGPGGLSGKPLGPSSCRVLQTLKNLDTGLILMSSGGIMDEKEAEKRLKDGASAIQLYSGLVYEGPGLVKRILNQLKG
jgi:dihydroorotate dehydrogenase